MDRKDFRILIEVLRDEYQEALITNDNDPDSHEGHSALYTLDTIENLVRRLSWGFRKEYDGFNRKKFIGEILGHGHWMAKAAYSANTDKPDLIDGPDNKDEPVWPTTIGPRMPDRELVDVSTNTVEINGSKTDADIKHIALRAITSGPNGQS